MQKHKSILDSWYFKEAFFGEVELFACDRYIAYQSDEKSHMSCRISHYGEGGDVTPSILNFMEMGIVSKLKTDH